MEQPLDSFPPMEPPPASPPPRKSPVSRNVMIAGVVGLVVLCCCCVFALAGLLYVDPFQLGLWERVFGGGDVLAAAVPADTQVYLAVDVAQLRSPHVQRLVTLFSDIAGQEATTAEDAIQKLDDQLETELGLTFSEDILPWAGQYVGMAVSGIDYTQAARGQPKPGDVVFLVEARDAAKAQAFVQKYVEAATNQRGNTFTPTDYAGVTIYAEEGTADTLLMLAYSKNIVLLSNSLPALQHVIDTQQGKAEALGKDPAYNNLRRQLPQDRLMGFFIPADALLQAVRESQQGITMSPQNQATLEAAQGVAMALSVTPDGVRMDVAAAYDEQALSADQRATMVATSSQALRRLPDDTLAYALSRNLNFIWQSYRTALEDLGGGDFDDAMAAFEDQYGFNPDTDFFPYLTGEFSLAVVPDADSVVAQSDVGDVGLVILAEVSDSAAMQTTLDKFKAKLEDQGMAFFTAETLAEVDAQGLAFSRGDDPAVIYGLGEDWLTIASSSAVFANTYEAGQSVAEAEAHKQIWAKFPPGTVPALFVDVAGALALAQDAGAVPSDMEDEVVPYVQPIQAVAVGSTPMKAGVVRVTLLVLIADK